MLKYISLLIASIIFIIHLIYLIINRKKIKLVDENFNKFESIILSPFFILAKNISIFSKLIPNKVKIAINNLYKKNYNLIELKLISKKLASIYYFLMIFLILSSIIGEAYIFFIGLIFIMFFLSFLDSNILTIYRNETVKFKDDLPSFIIRLTLLINSGIRIRTAIDFISENTNSEVAEKMKSVKVLVQNGMSEDEAYNTILKNTDDILIRKFISTIINNLKKGGDEIEKSLNIIKKESDEYKKSQIIIKTQEANRKLLFPNLVIFFGIMLIVMLPILLNAF